MSRTTKTVLIASPLAVAIPNFMPARATMSRNACVNNLDCIQHAKAKWARDLNKPNLAVPTEDDLRPVLKGLGAGDFLPRCPAGGTYSIGQINQPVTCSFDGPGHALPSDWKR